MRIHEREQFQKENVFGLGSPNDAYAQFFVGQSYLNPPDGGGQMSRVSCQRYF